MTLSTDDMVRMHTNGTLENWLQKTGTDPLVLLPQVLASVNTLYQENTMLADEIEDNSFMEEDLEQCNRELQDVRAELRTAQDMLEDSERDNLKLGYEVSYLRDKLAERTCSEE